MFVSAVTHFLLSATLAGLFPIDTVRRAAWANEFPGRAAPTAWWLEETRVIAAGAAVAENASEPVPTPKNPLSLGMEVDAESVIVRLQGHIVYEKNAREVRPIGSIAKLMTIYLVVESLGEEAVHSREPVQLIEDDLRSGGYEYVPFETDVALEDVFAASIIGSDNNATQALTRLTGLTEDAFVAKMNAQAAAWGMADTRFVDPIGLHAQTVSSAADVSILLEQVMQLDAVRALSQHATWPITFPNGRTALVESTNELLDGFLMADPYEILGGKTGYLPEAGYGLAMQVRKESVPTASVVVLGSETDRLRFQDAKALAYWVLNGFE